MSLEPVELRERGGVHLVDLPGDGGLAAHVDAREATEAHHRPGGLGPGASEEPGGTQQPVVALTSQQRAVDEDASKGGTATFQEAVEYFRKEKMLLLKPSTRSTYNNILDSELLPSLGDQLLADIGPRELSEMDARLAKRKVTASTRRNYQVVLRSVLKAAKVGELIAEVPRLPPLPKVGSKVARIPFAAEINAVIEAAKPHHRVALALGAYAGLRAGEIRGLRKRDVDLAGGVIVIRQAICHGIAAPPKSGHEREIPIAAPLRPFLEEAMKQCPTFDSPVAPTNKGDVWSEPGLRNMLVSLQRKLGLKGWT
ncbi:MAG: hypothetical protein EOO70_01570, partial [Myxococcaceae bacterium]